MKSNSIKYFRESYNLRGGRRQKKYGRKKFVERVQSEGKCPFAFGQANKTRN